MSDKLLYGLIGAGLGFAIAKAMHNCVTAPPLTQSGGGTSSRMGARQYGNCQCANGRQCVGHGDCSCCDKQMAPHTYITALPAPRGASALRRPSLVSGLM
jgi:hypothetical protein